MNVTTVKAETKGGKKEIRIMIDTDDAVQNETLATNIGEKDEELGHTINTEEIGKMIE